MHNLAFDRPIPIASHPASLQSYVLATPSIDEAYQHIKRCIRTRIPGSIIYAITRYGKTYFIRYAQIMVATDFPGIVAISLGCVLRKKPSESAFFSLLLEAVGHPKPTTGTIMDRRSRLINKLLDMLSKSGQRRLVLFADEAQKLEQEEYEWLWEVHDALERRGFRMTTFLVGQPKLVNRKNALKLSGESQIVARFMIEESQFHGLRSKDDVQRCMKGYDTSLFPQGSDWSFTRFFLPKAWSRGYRLETAAPDLWQTFRSVHDSLELPSGDMEIPMTYFARSVEYLLTEVAPEVDDFEFKFTEEHWVQAVDYVKFATAQEELLNKVDPNDLH
jgi:hypothetical protein